MIRYAAMARAYRIIHIIPHVHTYVAIFTEPAALTRPTVAYYMFSLLSLSRLHNAVINTRGIFTARNAYTDGVLLSCREGNVCL
jgi:hypothetical protein